MYCRVKVAKDKDIECTLSYNVPWGPWKISVGAGRSTEIASHEAILNVVKGFAEAKFISANVEREMKEAVSSLLKEIKQTQGPLIIFDNFEDIGLYATALRRSQEILNELSEEQRGRNGGHMRRDDDKVVFSLILSDGDNISVRFQEVNSPFGWRLCAIATNSTDPTSNTTFGRAKWASVNIISEEDHSELIEQLKKIKLDIGY